MRIRFPFAGAFFVLLLLAAWLGLLPHDATTSPYQPNDKVLHLLSFFVLTLVFYWIIDASRRRALNFSLMVCTALLGIGSEVVQALLPNGRQFDPFDIVANVVGSLAACGICSLYHKRMLERRRAAKYSVLAGGEGDEDVELGESSRGADGQETGVTGGPSLDQEIENWDENAEDAWDEEDGQTAESTSGDGQKTPPSTGSAGDEVETKRHD